MEIFRATQQDIGLLVQSRVDFLLTFRDFDGEVEKTLRGRLADYFSAHLAEGGGLAALYGMQDGELVATAVMLVQENIPADWRLDSHFGKLTSIYTYPQHRGKGYAKALLKELLALARREGLSHVELVATDEGLPLYRSLGFELQDGVPMWLKLEA